MEILHYILQQCLGIKVYHCYLRDTFYNESILESITLLLSKNAPVKTKNAQGWSSLMEAISYGNRQTSIFIFCYNY